MKSYCFLSVWLSLCECRRRTYHGGDRNAVDSPQTENMLLLSSLLLLLVFWLL
jgi:hypothetical protein